jgi:PPOX class probable F420-dependent enzyme
VDLAEVKRRLATSFVARLATVSAVGRPHVVPICFALDDLTLYFAVDAKPKRTTDLKRLRNISANPAVAILIDHYEEHWDKLWWVRVDGSARIVTEHDEIDRALDMLAERYEQYRTNRPGGPVVAVSIEHASGWSAS